MKKSPFELAGSLIGHTKSVVCLKVSLTVGCNMLYSGSIDQSIRYVYRELMPKYFFFLYCIKFPWITKWLNQSSLTIQILLSCFLQVWNIDTLQCTMTLNKHTGVVTSLLCWEQYLFSSSSDGTIKIWAMTEVGTLTVVYTHNEQSVRYPIIWLYFS